MVNLFKAVDLSRKYQLRAITEILMVAKRNTRTQAKIRAALTKLLPEKGLAGITVSDICRAADINRGTFYSHYTDKFDLMDQQIKGLTDDLTRIVLGDDDADAGASDDGCALFSKARVVECMRYVSDNYAFIAAITSNGSDSTLREYVKELIGKLFEQSAQARGMELAYEQDEYGREMLLSGVTAVFWLWLTKGCPESPEEITEIAWTHRSLSPVELAGA